MCIKKNKLLPVLLFLMTAACLTGCTPGGKKGATGAKAQTAAVQNWQQADGLSDYWYRGKAEISSYELTQNRYRDLHPGEVVLVFVTEDFLPEKRVKDEGGDATNNTLVLKNNRMRKFTTGVYEYSIMTSVFTPVAAGDYPYTLKVAHSSQDWCGQTYSQLNQGRNGYEMQLHSYFENEADQTSQVPLLPLEDELFNRIRIDPGRLPTGTFQMLPGLTYSRLLHQPFAPVEAQASLEKYTGDVFEGAD